MNIQSLYELGRDIPESIKDLNKYTWLGYHKILEIKYLDVNDILKNKLPIHNFISEHGSVLLIPNIVNGHVVDLVVRATEDKKMLNFNSSLNLPYNIGQLKNFKYGDHLFLVEGIADVAGLKLIDPDIHVVALKTNSISKEQYEIYKSLTNNVVLLLDNDKAGQMQLTKIRLKLKEYGIYSTAINQFGIFKDTGDVVDLLMSYYKTKDQNKLELLNNVNLYYKAQINLIKIS